MSGRELCPAVELLVPDKGSPLTPEGGIVEQEELRARSGPGQIRLSAGSAGRAGLRARHTAVAEIFVEGRLEVENGRNRRQSDSLCGGS